jgi:hypothetical protein
VKIKEIRAALVDITPQPKTAPRVPRQPTEGFASPMQRYPDLKRSQWAGRWTRVACVRS